MLQFVIAKENERNEGTCVGVSKWPVRDFNHRTTSDMWLYRAYSGNLYHGGELSTTFPGFTQGDVITCILDLDDKTISFAKNDSVSFNYSFKSGEFKRFVVFIEIFGFCLKIELQEPRVAFEDVEATELFPCVMFYSSNPGEKVFIIIIIIN